MTRGRRDGEMDAKPKSNKLKRLVTKRRLEAKAERLAQHDNDARSTAVARVVEAERVLKATKSLRRDPDRMLDMVLRGENVRVPLASDLHVIAELFRKVNAGGLAAEPESPRC